MVRGDGGSVHDCGSSCILRLRMVGQLGDDALQVEGAGGHDFINCDLDGDGIRALVFVSSITPNENPSQPIRYRRNEVV